MNSMYNYIKWLVTGCNDDDFQFELPGCSRRYENGVYIIYFKDPEQLINTLLCVLSPKAGGVDKYAWSDGTTAKFIKCRSTWDLKRAKKLYAQFVLEKG